MFDSFFNGLNSISPILPFLVRTLIVVVVALAVWFVVSLPAYWLWRTLGAYLTNAISRLAEIRHKLFARASLIFAARAEPINQFILVHAQMLEFGDENRQILKSIAHLKRAVEEIPNRIAALEASVSDAGNKFHQAASMITQQEVPQPTEPPTAGEFNLVQTRRNRAAVKLAFAVIIMPALVLFNTGMLSEFLDGFWPGLEYLGLPLSLIIAMFGTMLEIALGGFLVLMPSRRAQLALFVGIIFLAFVEVSFYAKLGQGFNWSLFDAFYPGGNAPQYTKMWFGVWGLVLVIGLAIAGHALVSSIVELTDNHVVRQWKRHLTSRGRHAKILREGLSGAEMAKGLLQSSLKEVDKHFDATPDVIATGRGAIEIAKSDFLNQIDRASAIRLENTLALDRGAMLRQFIECVCLAAGVGLAAILIGLIYGPITSHRSILPQSHLWLGWVVAAAEVIVLLGAGSFSVRGNATIPITAGTRVQHLADYSLARLFGLFVLILVLIANAFYLLHTPTATNTMLVVLVSAMNVFLFWCGSRLGMMGAAVWAIVLSTFHVLSAAIVWTIGVLAGALQLLCAAVRALLVVLAYPYTLIFSRDSSATQLSVTRGVT